MPNELLIKAFKDILDYPYISSTRGRVVEEEVSRIISENLGCHQFNKNDAKTAGAKLSLLHRIEKTIPPYVIIHPNGKQRAPDLRIFF